jgi:fumarate hydratase subunit beta
MTLHRAIYLAAIGGAGALIGRSIVGREVIAWPDLGAEALQRIEVRDFTCFVVNDTHGNDLYEQGRAAFQQL